MKGTERQPPSGRLTSRKAGVCRFNAVINGIADQMGERVSDLFDEGAIEFGICAIKLQLNLFAAGVRQIPDNSGEFTEELVDWSHAGLHGCLLQFSSHSVDAIDGRLKDRVFWGGYPQLVAGEDQFANKINDRIEQAHIDPNS